MKRRLTLLLATIGSLAALAAGGAAIAGAASSSSTSTTATPQATYPAHGTAAHEGQETSVTGDAAAKAQAAAVKLVGSGTAGAVTTDITGNGYEVTVTKADGSTVEIHLDSSFTAFAGGPGGG